MFDVYFLLVLLRITGFVFSAPFLGDRQIPLQVKLLFALLLSFAMYFSLPLPKIRVMTFPYLVFLGVGELLFGISVGFLASLPFFAIKLAGQVSGYQMGLAIANIFDPASTSQESVISAFLFWTTMMVFFLGDFHLLVFDALRISFIKYPIVVNFVFSPDQIMDLQKLVDALFVISVRVGAPIILTLLFVMVCLGVITRLIPQMNVFVVGLPVQILVGMLVLLGMTPLLTKVSRYLLLNHLLILQRFVGG